MEGVIGDGKGKGERVERNRGRDGEKSMNYPYIILSNHEFQSRHDTSQQANY